MHHDKIRLHPLARPGHHRHHCDADRLDRRSPLDGQPRDQADTPPTGWVEHDPKELFESCLETTEELLEMSEMHPRSIVAIGITNQRETLVMWDRRTGEPVANAIVWQCRRSAPICERLKSEGLEETVRSKTGLPIDPYFTGTKIRWLLDNIPDGQQRAERGDLACGTVDSWLVWNLTNKLVHATDATNASRTMLFRHRRDALGPGVAVRAGRTGGHSARSPHFQRNLRIRLRRSVRRSAHTDRGHRRRPAGVAFRPGLLRARIGQEHLRHGLFVLTNTGTRRVESTAGLISTVAWTLGGETTYALEGSIFSAGSTIQWLRDGLGLISDSRRVRRTGPAGARQRRRVPRSRLLGTRRSLLGRVRARRYRRTVRWNEQGAHSQGRPRVHRLPDTRRAGRDAPRRRNRPRLAQGRRRRDRQRLPHAVPGGHPWAFRSSAPP